MQTFSCSGGDACGATGDPTFAVVTQQENELFAKWKKRGTRKLSHRDMSNSGSENSIILISCLTRKATHTLEAS